MDTKYAYKITRVSNIISEDSDKLRKFNRGAGLTADDKKAFKAGKLIDGLKQYSFSVYDDDDEWYFGGYIQTNFGGEELFSPLDTIGSGYGCTYIKIDGKVL